MLKENITTIVEEIYELSKSNSTDIYYLHAFDEGATLKYKIDTVKSAPYKYQIFDFIPSKLSDFTKNDLRKFVADKITHGLNKLHADLSYLDRNILQIVVDNLEQIIEDISNIDKSERYYVNFNDKCEYSLTNAHNTSYQYQIFDTNVSYITKRHLAVKLLDSIPIIQKEWQFILSTKL